MNCRNEIMSEHIELKNIKLEEILAELEQLKQTSCRDCEYFGEWKWCKDCYGYSNFEPYTS